MTIRESMSKDPVTPYKMNLPTALKERLTEAAERSGRSLSSEIITRLQASITLADEHDLDFTYESMERMIEQIVREQMNEFDARLYYVETRVAGKDADNRWKD